MDRKGKEARWPFGAINYPCVTLIGMPGSGKSTLAKGLAKKIGWPWIDTDHLLESYFGLPLEDLRQQLGLRDFLNAEEELVAGLDVQRCIIATGGSVVYGIRAMDRLLALGKTVYLEAAYLHIEQRVAANPLRGLAMAKGQSLHDLFKERIPLYERYAQFKVRTDRHSIEQCIKLIRDWMKNYGYFSDQE